MFDWLTPGVALVIGAVAFLVGVGIEMRRLERW